MGHDPAEINIERFPEVCAYLSFLRLRNLSPKTVEHYRAALRDLAGFLSPSLDSLTLVSVSQLRQYVAVLQARGLKASTVNHRVAALKTFFRFLFAEGYIQTDLTLRLPTPKMGKRLPRALSVDETVALLAALDEDTSLIESRDKVLFYVMYTCGLRVGETVTLRVEDIDLEDSSLRVIGKGNRERRVYLKPPIVDLLRKHIPAGRREGYLFPGGHAEHLATGTVGNRLKVYLKKAGIKRQATPHTLRHSVAVHYLTARAPLSFVQGLLGHASLATTGIYLELSDPLLREIALKTETALDSPEPESGD